MGTVAAVNRNDARHRESADPLVWLKVLIVVGLIAGLYSFILPDLAVEWWTVEASSYGMLIPPIALYLAWLRRQDILVIPARYDNRGLTLVAGACVTFLLGQLAAEFFLARISFVLLLAGLTWSFWGFARLRALAFPFILLMTMVPLPGLVYNSVAAPCNCWHRQPLQILPNPSEYRFIAMAISFISLRRRSAWRSMQRSEFLSPRS